VSMTAVAVHGLPEDLLGQRFGIVDGLAGRVLITGKPVIVDQHSAFPRGIEQSRVETHAAASVPIRWSGQVRGALLAGSSDRGRGIGQRELEVLCDAAELGALALEHAEARQELEAAVRASVATLARAIDMRDPRWPQYGEEVAQLAAAVAGELGLAPEAFAELRL